MKASQFFIGNKKLTQRNLIIFISALLVIGSIFLFFASERNMDPSRNSDWWALRFTDAKNNGLDFVIENYGKDADFKWELFIGDHKLTENNIKVKTGENKKITLDINSVKGQEVLIVVSDGKIKKEIYKNP